MEEINELHLTPEMNERFLEEIASTQTAEEINRVITKYIDLQIIEELLKAVKKGE